MSSPFSKYTITKCQTRPLPILQPNMKTIFQICCKENSISSFSCASDINNLKQTKKYITRKYHDLPSTKQLHAKQCEDKNEQEQQKKQTDDRLHGTQQ